MTEEPDPSAYCSCEAVARGEFGVVDPKETVARVVCDPRHIRKGDGSIRPGIFPPSHIATKGLSLMRPQHLTSDELKGHADAVAAHDERDTAVGVIECTAEAIRALTQEDGIRSVCLHDDPVVDDPVLPDNPAHALLLSARELPPEDIAEIRDNLLRIFGGLRRFAA